MNRGDRGRVVEWVIGFCMVALSCTAVWAVFGDDLAALFGR